MKIRDLKHLTVLIGLVLLGQLNRFFKNDYREIDVFIGADATLYIDVILWDVQNLLTICVLLYLLMAAKKAINPRIILPFFIISLLDIADYFIAIQQFSYLKIPALVILIIFAIWEIARKKD